jgi:hypothetical protein
MKQYYSNKLVYALLGVALFVHGTITAQNVNVTASLGTAIGSYPSLSVAFDSINKGRHQGNIVLNIVNDCSEPTNPVSLLSNSYFSILIKPVGNRIVTGFPNLNRSVIELFGADNVTIDGDDPLTTGVRNLSIVVAAGFFTSTANIHIGSASALDPSTNILIKNCKITGARPNVINTTQNIGIAIGGSVITNINASGTNNSDITIDNNDIQKVLIGIMSLGKLDTPNSGIKILRNLIGSGTTVANDFVGNQGIQLFQSSTNAKPSLIQYNDIMVGVNTTTGTTNDVVAIAVFDGNPGLSIKANNIHDILNSTTSTTVFTLGIYMSGSLNTNMEISNNIIRDVVSAKKTTILGSQTNYGIYSFDIGSLRITHNTIGLLVPNTQGTLLNAVSSAVFLASPMNLTEFSNNIITNRNTSTSAFCFSIGSAAVLANTIMEKNCYHYPTGSMGNTSVPTTLNNWQTILSKDFSSFVESPKFVSTTNLHIQPGFKTQLESNAYVTSPSVFTDIDIDNRPGPTGSINGGGINADIGADEFDGIIDSLPVILNVTHNPTTQACFSQPRDITVSFVQLGNDIDSVMLEYTVNGGAKQFLKMTKSGATYTKTIPPVIPVTAIVNYRVFCMTSVGDTVFSMYNSYNDNTANAALQPTLLATPTQACSNSTINLSYSFLPDPTGFNFPPVVASPTVNMDIVNVKLNYINNISTVNSLTGTIGLATGIAGGYSNFRNIEVDTFSLGKSFPISISSTALASSKTYFAGFMDFNGDGDFNDAGENVFNSVKTKLTGNRIEKFNLYIPPNSRPGKTCLRVICSSSPIANAFSNFNIGEIEEYSVYIRPLDYTWMTGATVIGKNKPQSYVVTSLPNTVYINISDSIQPSPCFTATIGIPITQSPPVMGVTISAPATSCYDVPSLVQANVTGGCAPYTYTWSNIPTNTASQIIILQKDTLNLTVTVVDKNGLTFSAIKQVLPNNPQLTSVDSQLICNRGATRLTVVTASTDSAYWYNSSLASPYAFDSIGNNYTTPTLNASRYYYVAAFRSTSVSAGKLNLSGATVTTSAPHILNSGLIFTAQEPIQIKSCDMYFVSTATSTINIGLLDKYGSIITQTGNFVPPVSASATVPTVIPLNFIITNPDVGYRIVLLAASGITSLTRSTGVGYPVGPTLPLIVTGSYSIPSPALTDYFYFYNFRVLRGMCVGEKKKILAKVIEPRVPAIYTDLSYTQICKGKQLLFKVSSDSFGNRFVWTKNNIIQPDFNFFPAVDTTTDSTFKIITTKASDSGLYRVRVFSTKFCTRDTFSREVRVAFLPEPKLITGLKVTNICIGTDKTLSVNLENGYRYRWYKNNVLVYTGINDPTYLIDSATPIQDGGLYRVLVNDSNNCKTDTSLAMRNTVTVHPHPSIAIEPIDTVLCENDRYVIKVLAPNSTNFQWFKDNGIMNSFTKDSIVLYNALLSDSGQYRLIASSYPGCRDTMTRFAKLTVNPVPKILGFYQPNQKFCESQKIKLGSSTKDNVNVQWYKGTNPIGSPSDSFVVNSALLSTSGTYYFVAKAMNKCKDAKSDTINVNVVKKPGVSGSLPNINLCSGNEFKGGFPSTNGNMYQWYKNNIALQGAMDSQLIIRFVDARDTGRYFVKVNSDIVCPEVTSNSFRITVQQAPVIDVQPIGATACMGENIQLIVAARNSNGFQWRKDNANIGLAITNTYLVSNLSAPKEGKYVVEVKGVAPCPSIFSDTARIYHRSGNTNASASLVSQFNASEQCTDVNNWTYYAPNDDPTKYIFAVNKKGNIFTGKADVVVRPSVYQNINNSGKEYSATLMMSRLWNLKVENGDFIDPIDVKFYYNKKEEDDLNLKVLEFKNLFNSELTLENQTARWIKSDSIPFTSNLLNSIRGNNLGFKVVNIPTVLSGIENNVPYVELKNITNIGGGSAIYTFKGKTRIITSILNVDQAFSSVMSPIPNNGNFNLNIVAHKPGKINLAVINMLGQIVYTQDLKLIGTNTDNQISVSNLSEGIYQLLMTKDDYSSTIKFQVEH